MRAREVTNCASQGVLVTRLECHRGSKWENFAPDDALGAKITAAFTAQTSNWQLNTQTGGNTCCAIKQCTNQTPDSHSWGHLARRAKKFSACHILTWRVCARRKYDRKKCGFNKKFLSLRQLLLKFTAGYRFFFFYPGARWLWCSFKNHKLRVNVSAILSCLRALCRRWRRCCTHTRWLQKFYWPPSKGIKHSV